MENINEGKTKVIESISEHLVKITTKDVLTAFDSIKKDEYGQLTHDQRHKLKLLRDSRNNCNGNRNNK